MNTTKFKKGDRVKIVVNVHSGQCDIHGIDCVDEQECECDDYSYFDQYVGKEVTLTEFNCFNSDGVACWYTDLVHDISALAAGITGKYLSVCELDLQLI